MAKTYEDHFGSLTPRQRAFVLAASYADCMASLGENLRPNLTNFVNLVHSMANYELIQSYVDKGIVFAENKLGQLKNRKEILTAADVEHIIPLDQRIGPSTPTARPEEMERTHTLL